MEALVRALGKINAFLDKIAGKGLILFMAVMAVTIPYAVFSRYVLKDIPIWTDEVSLFSLAWATMLGAAAGLKRGYQLGIESLTSKAPPAVAKAIRVAAYAFSIVFLGVMTWFGVFQTVANARQLSAAIKLPMAVPYAALPVGFAIMLLFTIEEALSFLKPGRGQAPGETAAMDSGDTASAGDSGKGR